MACSTGVDRAAIGNGKEEAVVLWPGICSTIVSFRYHFILGVSRFLTVCETSSSLPPSTPFLPSSLSISLGFGSCRAVAHSIFLLPFRFPTFASSFRDELLSASLLCCFGSIFGAKLNFMRCDHFLRYFTKQELRPITYH